MGGTSDGRQVAHLRCIGLHRKWPTVTGMSVDRMAGTEPINEPLWIPA